MITSSCDASFNSLQEAFLEEVNFHSPLCHFFDCFPGVFVFIKDDQGRMVHFNSALLEQFGAAGNDEILGMSDYDFFIRSVADAFVEDDKQVMSSGRALINRVESWRNDRQVQTNKFPLKNRHGLVVGLLGTFQVCQSSQPAAVVDPQLTNLAEYIEANLHLRPTIKQLASRVFMSERQLRRRFQKAFGVSIQQYQIDVRIDAARQMLLSEQDLSIVEIAQQLGFCDQSAFTRSFRDRVGTTPLRFRQQTTKGRA